MVDDEAIIRQLIVINLELEGFEVHTAANGAEALAKAREVRPRVITLDVMMPNMDGWATAQQLRADPQTRDARIVFISARGRPGDVSRGLQLGEAYLTKPFDPDEVVEAVRRLAAEDHPSDGPGQAGPGQAGPGQAAPGQAAPGQQPQGQPAGEQQPG